MRASHLALVLGCLLMAPVMAGEDQPDSELLEYLGEWAGTDKDWADPVDIQDMKLEDKESVTEKTQ